MDNFLNFFYSYLDKNQRKKLFVLNNKKKYTNFFEFLNKEMIEKIEKKIIHKEIYFFKKCKIDDIYLIQKYKDEILKIFKENLNIVLFNYFVLSFSDNLSTDISNKLSSFSNKINDFYDKTAIPIENDFYFEEKNFLNIGHFLNSYYENKIDIFGHTNDQLTVNNLSYFYINDFDFFFIDYIDKCVRFVFNNHSILDNYYLKNSHLIEDKKISTDICLHITPDYIKKIFSMNFLDFKNYFDIFDYINFKNNNLNVEKYNTFNKNISNLIYSFNDPKFQFFVNDNEYRLSDLDHKSILKIINQLNSYFLKNIKFSIFIKEKTLIENCVKVQGFEFDNDVFHTNIKKNKLLKSNEIFINSNIINDFILFLNK